MSQATGPNPDILTGSPIQVESGAGSLSRLGSLSRSLGANCVLLVTDPGIEDAGHAAGALGSLKNAGLEVVIFDGVHENPTTEHVAAGIKHARNHEIDLIVGLGGGSAMDCAKGINLLLTNSGEIRDYWGEGKASEAMLPLIAVPTTAGTGSEAQSFALIGDPDTHQKMACGDRRDPREGGLRPRIAILDHELTKSQPPKVAAASAVDALSHVVETIGTTAQTESSLRFSREAWSLVNGSFERAMENPEDADARRDMLWGAHLAGVAIEQSMLGAAHACANPLTATLGIVHGVAVGIMLPHVVRFNTTHKADAYAVLGMEPTALIERITHLLMVADMPDGLRACGVSEADIPKLAASASTQWTGKYNPLPVEAHHFEQIYKSALDPVDRFRTPGGL